MPFSSREAQNKQRISEMLMTLNAHKCTHTQIKTNKYIYMHTRHWHITLCRLKMCLEKFTKVYFKYTEKVCIIVYIFKIGEGGFLCLMILGRILKFKFDWAEEDVIKFLTLS